MTQEDDALPRRSPDGLAALDVFYDEYNDIHFFVEDEDQENLYEVLLRKMFPGLTIARIFPLGGKAAVIRDATECPQDETKPYRVYIVDKDFDDLLGSKVSEPHLFYLDRYCIENFLIDPSAIVEVIVECHPRLKRRSVVTSLALPNAITSIFAQLRPLFTLFFCVQLFDLGIRNCGTKPDRYCNHRRRWEIESDAVESYKEEVLVAAATVGLAPPIVDPFLDERLAAAVGVDDHSLVSGKYVCAMLLHYLKASYSLGVLTLDAFIYRLAKNCEVAPLRDLARRIAATAIAARPELSVHLAALG